MSAPFGSRLNYFFFAFWLFMAYAGWAIALGSLSALQHYENHSGLSDGTNGEAILYGLHDASVSTALMRTGMSLVQAGPSSPTSPT